MISKIFIVHYTKLEERKKHMIVEMEKWFQNIPYEFMEKFDQEDVTDSIRDDHIDTSTFIKKHNREIKPGEASLCIKYQNILKKIVEEEEGEYYLILEDDVIFKEDPVTYIKKILALCEEQKIKFDCVFMGEAALRVGDNRDIFEKKSHPATNGLCTVMYKKEAISRLYKSMCSYRVTEPLDWEFNNRFERLNFEVYWAKAITEHGSVSAVRDPNLKGLKSSLRDKY